MRITRTWQAMLVHFATTNILVYLMAYSLTGDITWWQTESLSIWSLAPMIGVAGVVSTLINWSLLRPEPDDPDRLDKFAAEAAKARRWAVIATSIIAAWALVRFLVSAAAG